MKKFCSTFLFLLIVVLLQAKSLYTINGNSVIVDLDGIGMKSRMLKVVVCSDRTVKIVSGMETTFSDFQGYITTNEPSDARFKVAYAQNNIEVTTKNMILSIQEDGLVRIFNREGNKLIIESDRSFEPSNSNEAKFKINQRYFLNMNENIYGFGFSDQKPRYSLRGQSYEISQNSSSIASPIFYSEKGYAIIWDNYSRTNFNDQKGGLDISSDLADEIQYYIVFGPTWDDIITEIRSLTGNVPMLPRWAFAHWGLSGTYDGPASLRDKVEQYNAKGVPAEKETTPDYNLFEEEKSFANIGVKERQKLLPAYPSMRQKYAELNSTVYDRRPCIPTFTNYPGIQAYGTFVIAGEINPSWASLRGQVDAGLSLSLSGQPYWATLIGGASVEVPDPELLTRWYQFAAFTPVFVLPKPDRDLFSIKQPEMQEAVSSVIKLRYHLLPYIYSAAYEVSNGGKTFTRSLLFDFLEDNKTHAINQQYMFGGAMMVCPVTDPSAKQINVYFPAGTDWYDFYTGKLYNGATTQKINVSINNIPVFVKSGSIIPFATIGSNASDSLNSSMELRVYPGNNASFTLYEDNNDGPGYRNGQSAKIPFIYTEKDKSFTVGTIEGSYSGMTPQKTFRVVIVSDSTGLGNNFSESFNEILYKGKKLKIKL